MAEDSLIARTLPPAFAHLKSAVTEGETSIGDAARAVHDAFQLDKEPAK